MLMTKCCYANTGVLCINNVIDNSGLCGEHLRILKDDRYNISVPDMILHRIRLLRSILKLLCGQKVTMIRPVRDIINELIDDEPIITSMMHFSRDLDQVSSFLDP